MKCRYRSDAEALDAIVRLLDRQEWNADTLDNLAAVVESTGREIREPEVGRDSESA